MKTDHELKEDVTKELLWEPSVLETHVGVTVKDGIVTLTGHVPTYAEKHGAEKAVKRVQGVKAVANELDVHLSPGTSPTDEDLARSCVQALAANSVVPRDKVRILVDHGWITLEGTLEWQYQKTAAERALRYLVGVRGVANRIELTPRATPAGVKAKIEAAFKRSAEIDAKRISVDTRDGTVFLHGTVHSLAEKQEAIIAAWAAPGVHRVENDLVVMP